MSKGAIILVIAIVVIIVGVAAWFAVSRGTNANVAPEATNGGTNAAANANSTAVPTEATSGDHAINKSLTYRDVTFDLTSALDDASFGRETAAAGKAYLVIFLQPLAGQELSTILSWIQQATSLRSGESAYALKRVKLLGSAEGNAGAGYLWFEVEAGKADWTLVMGSGEGAQSVALGF